MGEYAFIAITFTVANIPKVIGHRFLEAVPERLIRVKAPDDDRLERQMQ